MKAHVRFILSLTCALQVSTFATVLGGACLLLAVFSGPVLALLTVITLGTHCKRHSSSVP